MSKGETTDSPDYWMRLYSSKIKGKLLCETLAHVDAKYLKAEEGARAALDRFSEALRAIISRLR